MNEQRVYDEAPFRPQGLQMPQQAPPVDRREAGPGPVAEGDGVAASSLWNPIVGWDDFLSTLPSI